MVAEQLPRSAWVEGAELGTHGDNGDVAAANSALKLLLELSQRQDEASGPVNFGKDTEAPRLLSVVS